MDGIDTQTLVLLVLVVFTFVAVAEGNVGYNNWLVYGPAIFIDLPFQIFQTVATTIPILIPLVIIGLLVYFNVLKNLVGVPIVMLALVLFVLMYLW